MTALIGFALGFIGIHLLVSGTPLRARLVAALGLRGYLGLFSLASAVTLGGLIVSYLSLREPQASALWPMRHAAVALMWPALWLILAGVMSRGPTSAGGERALADGVEAHGVHRITRHPFLWGMSLWAGVHAVWNPQAESLWFFGSFLVVSLAGTRLIDAKRRAGDPAGWAAYAAQTSNLPFAAIVSGRNRLSLREIGWLTPLAATGLWLLLASQHGRLFDLPVI